MRKWRPITANSRPLRHQLLLTIAETGGTNGYHATSNQFGGFAMTWPQDKVAGGTAGRRVMIKTFVMAAAMLALVVMPAHAQMNKHGKTAAGPDTEQPKRVDDKAYKAALEKIPEPKEKYDPWGVARPADTAKKPK
jgi:hypothetical protein